MICGGCRKNRRKLRPTRVLGETLQLCGPCRQLSLQEWMTRRAQQLGLRWIVNSDMTRWLD